MFAAISQCSSNEKENFKEIVSLYPKKSMSFVADLVTFFWSLLGGRGGVGNRVWSQGRAWGVCGHAQGRDVDGPRPRRQVWSFQETGNVSEAISRHSTFVKIICFERQVPCLDVLASVT